MSTLLNGATYLGDEVYVRKDRWGMLTLFTVDEENERNVIHLEPETYAALVSFVARALLAEMKP